jgi:hypothetical protein
MSTRKLGDFDGNGIIDGRDAAGVSAYVSERNMNKTIDPQPTEEDLKAASLMHNGEVTYQDANAISALYALVSVDAREYPKTQPSNWTDSGVDGYKKYFYIDAEGNEVSLASEATAPTWENKKYYYKNSSYVESLNGGDYVVPLVTQLP